MPKKGGDMVLYILIGVLVFYMFSGQNETTAPATGGSNGGNGGVDLCEVVEPSLSITAQRMFLTGTAITVAPEQARVIKINGDGKMKDLGMVSSDSGTINTAPHGTYKIYFGENSSTYYTDVEDYTAPCQDAPDDKVGLLCTIDTAPTITVYDENGNVNSDSSAQAIGSSDEINIEVKIKAAADKCYGNPDAPKGNVVCAEYDSGNYTSVKFDGLPTASAPNSIVAEDNASTHVFECFEFDKIADTSSVRLPVTVKAATGKDPSGVNCDIRFWVEDVAFDLNQDNLEEIWDYEDESNTNLGASSAVYGELFIS